jgi:hypothetical protein
MIRVPLTIEEFRAMAFGRSRRSSTISLTNACRAGVSNELMIPCTTCSQMICLTVMMSVNVNTASSADCTSDATWVHSRIRRRSWRSTSTPANGVMMSVGI